MVVSQSAVALRAIEISQRSPAARSIVRRAAGSAPDASYGIRARYASMKRCRPVRLAFVFAS